MLLLSSFFACNHYEYFNIAGYEQSDFSNKADILFVIDNSPSMKDESVALGRSFSSFINLLTSEDGATESTENLDDAVDAFVSSITQQGKFIDYQLAITTTSVDYTNGPSTGIDPGEAGLLIGDEEVLSKYDSDINLKFRKNLFCNATYWTTGAGDPEAIPIGDDSDCDGDGSEITQAYLSCLCDGTDWQRNSGAGNEEHLEAALLAMCRAVPEPPELCYDPPNTVGPVFQEGDELTNEGLLRDNSTTVFVIVSDEGDNSTGRVVSNDSDITPYLEAFEEFDRRVRFAVIGPYYDSTEGDGSCLAGATSWGVERLQQAARETQGFYNTLTGTPSEGCAPDDFDGHLEDLGALLNSLETIFQLRSVPDVTTIQVYVNGEEVAESPILNNDDYEASPNTISPIYGDGWSYSSSSNAVVFWGTSVPDYNEDVRIYYRPIGGTPRELPFEY